MTLPSEICLIYVYVPLKHDGIAGNFLTWFKNIARDQLNRIDVNSFASSSNVHSYLLLGHIFYFIEAEIEHDVIDSNSQKGEEEEDLSKQRKRAAESRMVKMEAKATHMDSGLRFRDSERLRDSKI